MWCKDSPFKMENQFSDQLFSIDLNSTCVIYLLFSCLVMSDSLLPHELQHARLPCPSPSPRAYSNSCSLSWWCHPTILSSVIPFSSCLQCFRESGSFLMSQLFASGGQSIRASASASVLPMNIQDWFPLRLTGLISLQSKGFSRVFSKTTVQKYQFFGTQSIKCSRNMGSYLGSFFCGNDYLSLPQQNSSVLITTALWKCLNLYQCIESLLIFQ